MEKQLAAPEKHLHHTFSPLFARIRRGLGQENPAQAEAVFSRTRCFYRTPIAALFRAFAFFVVFDARTLGSTGIAVSFVVAAADGVILHGANTVGFGVFHAFVRFAGKNEKAEARCAQREKNVFHWKRKFRIVNENELRIRPIHFPLMPQKALARPRCPAHFRSPVRGGASCQTRCGARCRCRRCFAPRRWGWPLR